MIGNGIYRGQPTSQESVLDVLSVNEYIRIDIVSDGEVLSNFVYQKDAHWYMEQPYQGIYKTDEKTVTVNCNSETIAKQMLWGTS